MAIRLLSFPNASFIYDLNFFINQLRSELNQGVVKNTHFMCNVFTASKLIFLYIIRFLHYLRSIKFVFMRDIRYLQFIKTKRILGFLYIFDYQGYFDEMLFLTNKLSKKNNYKKRVKRRYAYFSVGSSSINFNSSHYKDHFHYLQMNSDYLNIAYNSYLYPHLIEMYRENIFYYKLNAKDYNFHKLDGGYHTNYMERINKINELSFKRTYC